MIKAEYSRKGAATPGVARCGVLAGAVPACILAAAILFTSAARAAAQGAPAGGETFAAPAGSPPLQQQQQQRVSVFHAAILGVVEGITEYLPVSSTGHLILAGRLLGIDGGAAGAGDGEGLEKPRALEAFEIVIQFGAILAVIGLYRKRVAGMLAGLAGKNRDGLRLAGLLIVAFIPAAATGLLWGDLVMDKLFNVRAVAIALAAGGAVMIAAGPLRKRLGLKDITRIEDITWRHAAIIGLAQCLALWPGTSRSMVTILAGMFAGMGLVAAAEFSFLLALPTLGAATVYSAARHWPELTASAGLPGILVGICVSWAVAALAMRLFVKWLTSHGLAPFGIYRIALALAVLLA